MIYPCLSRKLGYSLLKNDIFLQINRHVLTFYQLKVLLTVIFSSSVHVHVQTHFHSKRAHRTIILRSSFLKQIFFNNVEKHLLQKKLHSSKIIESINFLLSLRSKNLNKSSALYLDMFVWH